MKTFNEFNKEISEADFGSMASQLKKYGGKENVKDTPKAPQTRSKYAPDYTMTGHKEKNTSTGRQYSKVLPDYDDEDDVKSAKKSVTTGATPQEKRGRGRPKGVGAKAGQYKPRDPEKKAASAAKAAASKAANKAKKAALTNEDCEEIFEGLTFDDMMEVMIDEEVLGLDEISKETLGSYVKKSDMDMGSKFYDSGRDETKDKKSSYHSFRAAEKRQRGINKAVAKLTKEDLDEAEKIKVGSVVTPKIGPHAGRPHTVIHAHDDGSFNIKPNMDVKKVKYHLGAARCTKDQLQENVEDINEMYHAGGTINSAGKTSNGGHMGESVERVDELNKETLKSYVGKAKQDRKELDADWSRLKSFKADDAAASVVDKYKKRGKMIRAATKRLQKESENLRGSTGPQAPVDPLSGPVGPVGLECNTKSQMKDNVEFVLEDLEAFLESEEFNSLDETELNLFENIFNESSDTVVKDKSGKVVKFKHKGDWKDSKKDPIVDKSGAKHTAHSRVRDLARNAIKRASKGEINFVQSQNESEKAGTKPAINDAVAFYASKLTSNLIKE